MLKFPTDKFVPSEMIPINLQSTDEIPNELMQEDAKLLAFTSVVVN